MLRTTYFSSDLPTLHVVLADERRQNIEERVSFKVEAFICKYQRADMGFDIDRRRWRMQPTKLSTGI
jgi:hypothetical protein